MTDEAMTDRPDPPHEGGCQCGAVRYVVAGRPLTLYACHCRECQQQSGSAFGMSLIVPLAGFAIEGPVESFRRTAASGNVSDCHYCARCGTRIFHARVGADRAALKPGTLDRRDWLVPVAHIWTSEKQAWTVIRDGVLAVPGNPDMPRLFELWAATT